MDATNLTVGSDFSAVALTASGALGLRGATIPGRFSLVMARLSNPAGLAVWATKHRHHRATLPWWARTWGHLQDLTVGYGFRPWRAAAWLIALMTAGAALFAAHHPPPLKRGEAPQFNPVIYTLDLLLPIIDLGQEKAFKPEGWVPVAGVRVDGAGLGAGHHGRRRCHPRRRPPVTVALRHDQALTDGRPIAHLSRRAPS